MIYVNIHEAKAQLSHLVKQILAGEEVTLCRHNLPVVRMSKLEEKQEKPSLRKRKLGFAKGMISHTEDCFAPYTEEELTEWEEGHPGDPLRQLYKK